MYRFWTPFKLAVFFITFTWGITCFTAYKVAVEVLNHKNNSALMDTVLQASLGVLAESACRISNDARLQNIEAIIAKHHKVRNARRALGGP